MRVGLIGNTELTSKGLELLIDQGHEVDYVFGLEQRSLKNKVNASDLKAYCLEQNIEFIEGGRRFAYISQRDVDLVIALGDSRLIPVDTFRSKVIGNHGAPLPDVKGGASLVWARIINYGFWGVSLMVLDEELDSGEILGVTKFEYSKDMNMEDFVSLCDDETIKLLDQYLNNTISRPHQQNEATVITVKKHTDSELVEKIAKFAMEAKCSIYLPPRTPEDSIIKDSWSEEFKQKFMIANDHPYPEYKYE